MAKYVGNGTTVAVTTSTTGGAGTTIGGILSVDGPSGSAADVDVTTLDTTGGFAIYARGFADAGEVSYTMAYDPADAGWLKLKAMQVSGVVGTFTHSFASTALSDHAVNAYVKSVGRAIARDAMITRTFTVRPSSGPGWN